MGIGPGWDCGRCRLDGPNDLLLHCSILRCYDSNLPVSILSIPFIILFVSIRSPLILLNSNDYRPSLLLKDVMQLVSITLPGSTFQTLTTLWVRKCFLTFPHKTSCPITLNLCPLLTHLSTQGVQLLLIHSVHAPHIPAAL